MVLRLCASFFWAVMWGTLLMLFFGLFEAPKDFYTVGWAFAGSTLFWLLGRWWRNIG